MRNTSLATEVTHDQYNNKHLQCIHNSSLETLLSLFGSGLAILQKKLIKIIYSTMEIIVVLIYCCGHLVKIKLLLQQFPQLGNLLPTPLLVISPESHTA